MYLISIYFDEKTTKRIQGYIDNIAKKTGNTFMTNGNVLPHITISAFETQNESEAIDKFQNGIKKIKSENIQLVSVGMFLPYVIYITPVLNEYLYELQCVFYEEIKNINDIKIRSNYTPFNWLPHITVGKKLSTEEMKIAFNVMQNQFGAFEGKVTKIGLAKTNPYYDIITYEL
ncbi:MAG: 2'-5' RNA ligase family protein [Lachnospiraceae bacterium]|nr:2'-5' RNA ligase family protein [Lachnospiraceae bacterium]